MKQQQEFFFQKKKIFNSFSGCIAARLNWDVTVIFWVAINGATSLTEIQFNYSERLKLSMVASNVTKNDCIHRPIPETLYSTDINVNISKNSNAQ